MNELRTRSRNKIGAQSADMKMTHVWQNFPWKSYNEEAASYDDNSVTTVGLMEQINIARDVSDYLCVRIGSNEAFLRNENYPQLTAQSAGHALHVFINGQLSGTAYGSTENPKLTYTSNVRLRPDINTISLLSIVVGLPIWAILLVHISVETVDKLIQVAGYVEKIMLRLRLE